MKAHLLYRDRDFDFEQELPASSTALLQDLRLEVVFNAMADRDEFLFNVARHLVVVAPRNGVDEIRYRQAVLRDCLNHPEVVRRIYAVAIEAIEEKKKQWLGIFTHYPSGVLSSAVELMKMFAAVLGKLRAVADEHAGEFESEGFKSLLATIQTELSDDYFATIKAHLKELRFDHGVLISVELGQGGAGKNYVLRHEVGERPRWFERIFDREPAHTFHIDPRDEAGAKALGELRDRGINLVANALGQSADHILSFFVMLRRELAFYLGCVNLHQSFRQRGVPVCFPMPEPAGLPRLTCTELRDASLVLNLPDAVVGNDLAADGKKLCVITGANQGGKSTFMRAIGLAQLMMQAGMFVAARSFSADVCHAVLTHYKREEDVAMKSGKLDEELKRMSELVDALEPDSLVLFNESFAATNEREGSEIARQITRALLETRAKVIFVTHLYDFAHRLWSEKSDSAFFLRAERQPDGTRTYKLRRGEPLHTSFGGDLYRRIFEVAEPTCPTATPTRDA